MPKTETLETEQTEKPEQTPAAGETAVQTAEFEEVADAGPAGQENLSVLLDIQMPITAVLGKTEVPFRRLLQLGPGSVLELDQAIGQPAELYVQGIRLATGDVVVVNENYGLRIREVMGAEVKQLDPTLTGKNKKA
jgi:flagellar motor switch protein FliN/FliY